MLVGIISDRDIFRALVDITGVRHGGHRICVTIPDAPGTIREVTDIVRQHGFHLRGILSSYEGVPKGIAAGGDPHEHRGGLRGAANRPRGRVPAVRINRG